MSDRYRYILIILGIVTTIVIISFGMGKRYALNRLVLPQEARVDTLFIRDTIVHSVPEYITKTEVRKELVRVTDTLRIQDTLYVAIPFEKKFYKTDEYYAEVSGYQPSLDRIDIYQSVAYVTKEKDVLVKVKPRWSVGITAGYGAVLGDPMRMTPYVGVGLTYNLFSW